MRILVVDDSVVFRSAIKAALNGVNNIEVVGTANNGKIALQKLEQMSIDLVILDMEMPEMSGIETIKEIKKAKFPVKIIIFSSHTARGSELALEALTAGADDLVAKPNASDSGAEPGIEQAATRIRVELLPKVLQFLPSVLRATPVSSPSLVAGPTKTRVAIKDIETFRPNAIVIGSSTGGPPALENVLRNLSNPLSVPIFIAQHMPPIFTASLAKRLTDTSGILTAEGKDGEEVVANRIYIAPGDFHMEVKLMGTKAFISLNKNPQRNSVRPAVDFLFETAAAVYGAKTMSIILTGMGEDGLVGAQAIKKVGGGVLIQDKASCVVFGMPGAIFAAEIYDSMENLEKINSVIKRMVS